MNIISPRYNLYLIFAIACSLCQFILLRYSSANGANPIVKYSLFGLALLFGAVGIFSFSKTLEKFPLSSVYPVFSGGVIVGTVTIGILFFGENGGVTKIFGSAIIMLGIFLVFRS